jgi:hypothetical protein
MALGTPQEANEQAMNAGSHGNLPTLSPESAAAQTPGGALSSPAAAASILFGALCRHA